ncbi:MAG: hypothetical protein JKX76_00760 [Colwellia sp.]|nr:hypothetical protein [Colwellia sp.]
MDLVVSTVRGMKFVYDKFDEVRIANDEITELRKNIPTTETILRSAIRIWENVEKRRKARGGDLGNDEALDTEEIEKAIIDPAVRLAQMIENVSLFLERMKNRKKFVSWKKAAQTIIEINTLHREVSYAIENLNANISSWETSLSIQHTLDNMGLNEPEEDHEITVLRNKLERYPAAINRKEKEIIVIERQNAKHLQTIAQYTKSWGRSDDHPEIIDLRRSIDTNEIKILEIQSRLEELNDNKKICQSEINLKMCYTSENDCEECLIKFSREFSISSDDSGQSQRDTSNTGLVVSLCDDPVDNIPTPEQSPESIEPLLRVTSLCKNGASIGCDVIETFSGINLKKVAKHFSDSKQILTEIEVDISERKD